MPGDRATRSMAARNRVAPWCNPILSMDDPIREERDGNFACTEGGVQLQRAIKKINRKYGTKTMTYDQNLVCIRIASRCDDLRGQSVQSLLEDRITLPNIVARKTPVVKKCIQVQPAPGANQKRCEHDRKLAMMATEINPLAFKASTPTRIAARMRTPNMTNG